MISYVLAPNPVLQLTDNQGNYVPYGTVLTLDWDTRQPKATYYDPGGLKPRPNPFPLDSVGRAFEVYWEDDAAYFLLLANQQGQVIWQSAEPFIPTGGGGGTVTSNIELQNLIINGQMRFAPIGKYEPIEVGETFDVALGGWSFIKEGTNTDDLIQFVPFTLDSTAVDATPIFYFNYIATGAGSGQSRLDLQFRIKDVRSLSAEQVTVSLDAIALIGGAGDIDIIAVQDFGSTTATVTPSAPVFFPLTTITPTASWATYTTTNILPSLTGKTVSDAGDDFLGIIFRMPLDMVTNLGLTNFYLKRGAAANNYPYQTYAEVLAQLNTYPLPNYITDFPTDITVLGADDAYNVLTLKPANGLISYEWMPPVPIGTTFPYPSETPPPGYVMANGAWVFKNGQYNRLYNLPVQGSILFGEAYFTQSNMDNNIYATIPFAGMNNVFLGELTDVGVGDAWSAGTSPFTITHVTEGHADQGIVNIAPFNMTTAYFRNTSNGTVAAPVTDTTMTITIVTLGNPSTPAEWNILAIDATGIMASQYVTYHPTVGNYYVWFNKDGVGTDPALPGFTASYEIKIVTGNTALEISLMLQRAIAGIDSWSVNCTDGASLTPADYFTVGNIGTSFSMYYRIDGSNTIPVVATDLIPIEVLSTDTNVEIATKTAAALNPLRWKLPDWRGSFIRFWDDGRGLDPDSASRTNRGDGTTGDHVGTFQDDENKSHSHSLSGYTGAKDDQGGVPGSINVGTASSTVTNNSGGNESRPKNYYFNCIVKY